MLPDHSTSTHLVELDSDSTLLSPPPEPQTPERIHELPSSLRSLDRSRILSPSPEGLHRRHVRPLTERRSAPSVASLHRLPRHPHRDGPSRSSRRAEEFSEAGSRERSTSGVGSSSLKRGELRSTLLHQRRRESGRRERRRRRSPSEASSFDIGRRGEMITELVVDVGERRGLAKMGSGSGGPHVLEGLFRSEEEGAPGGGFGRFGGGSRIVGRRSGEAGGVESKGGGGG
jgi:hypothetical protein